MYGIVYIGQMTVGQLKEKLNLLNVPDDFVIFTEGCDCIGPSADITVSVEERCVTINRNDSLSWRSIDDTSTKT